MKNSVRQLQFILLQKYKLNKNFDVFIKTIAKAKRDGLKSVYCLVDPSSLLYGHKIHSHLHMMTSWLQLPEEDKIIYRAYHVPYLLDG